MGFPSKVSKDALVACGRCCSICHKFCGLKIELHHIEQKAAGGKDTFENCIPLCFDCHADMRSYDHRHPKGQKYSEAELRQHRDNWYEQRRSAVTIPNVGSPQPATTNKVSLEAKLSFAGDVYTLQRVGCAGMQVSLINRAERVARVRAVEARLKGFNVLPNMQKGFGNSFGYTPTDKPEADAVFVVELLPLCRPAAEDCSLIEQDQALRFVLPFCNAAAPIFLEKSAENLSLYAIMDDESELLLVSGISLIDQLKTTTDLLNGQLYEPKRVVRISQTVISKTKPTQSAVGTVNVNPISFALDGNEVSQSERTVDGTLRKIIPLFGLIWDNWSITKRFEYRVIPTTPLEEISSKALRSKCFWVGLGNVGAELDGREVAILFTLISDQAKQFNDAKGNLKIPSAPEFSSLVNLQPTDDEITIVISKLEIENAESMSVP